MIVKIKSHKRAVFKQVLSYMTESKDRLYDARAHSFALTHNVKGKTVDAWVKQLRENEALRTVKRKDNVKLTHEILSWHKDDARRLTLEKMEAMAREYIRLRNPRGMYVAVPHFDKDHYHVHVLASGVEYKTGKSMWMYKADFQKLKVDIQRYQQERFPELSNSTVEHGKGGKPVLTEPEYRLKRRSGRETEKEKLIGMLKTCYKKAGSRETFFQMLAECGLKTYERGGKVYGVESGGKKFRFNTRGYTEERMVYLDRTSGRKDELQVIRRSSAQPLRNDKHFKEPINNEAGSTESDVTGVASRRKELEALRNLGADGAARRKSL